MPNWIIRIAIVLCFGCQTIRPISPSDQELNISENFNNYTFSDKEGDPICKVRISIHVIQDSSGNGNFNVNDSLGNNSPEWYWLKGLVMNASDRMADLKPMQLPSSSRHIKDSRIRYDVIDVYAWQNQELFELSKVRPSTGDRMYRYIMEQTSVTHKENSLHLFIAGSLNRDNGRITSRGIASGAPDKKWTVLFNYYDQYERRKNYWPATLVSHEIGHNLGLSHTWNQNDGCNDTPQKSPQCWALNEPKSSHCDTLSECSNNLMDYNAWQNALTECQLSKIHYNIIQNKGNLQDIIYWDPERQLVSCENIEVANTIIDNGIVNLVCTDNRPVKWYITPRSAVVNPIGTGTDAHVEVYPGYNGKAVITFRMASSESEVIEISQKIKLRTTNAKL